MAHVHHHHVARNPVMAQWHKHNLALALGGDVATVTSVVIKTLGPGESAPTPTPDGSAEATSAVTRTVFSTAPSRQVRPDPSSTSSQTSASPTTTSSKLPSSKSIIVAPTSTLASSVAPKSLLLASTTAPLANALNSAAPASTSGAATAESTQAGMSGGAKAGLAIGILLIAALVAALVVFMVRRKKQSDTDGLQRLDDEKREMQQSSYNIPAPMPVTQAKTEAPRLSLRPLTQMFMPVSEKHDAFASSRATSPESSNPFADDASAGEKPVIATPVAAAVSSSNASDRTLSNLSDRSSPSEGQSPAAIIASRRNSPPGPGPNNVHRIQLDFKPSMEDELELRAGGLVRLLHEYDDGWALCIRLDRSQQGVVPRTCVSKLPVKPRPAPSQQSSPRGPPPQSRIAGSPRMAPNGPPRSVQNAARMRAQSNAPRQQQGMQGPDSQQKIRPRSNSDVATGGVEQLAAAPITQSQQSGPPTRKPVPGQAL